jgi:hypothetical protein
MGALRHQTMDEAAWMRHRYMEEDKGIFHIPTFTLFNIYRVISAHRNHVC